MILAIESATNTASVALVDGKGVLAEMTLNGKKTHSQTLMPLIEQMMALSGQRLEEIEAIAVSGGPGSYTGLRIGAATAKGLAQVLDKPIIGISTLETLAAAFCGMDATVCTMLDARRSHVFTCTWKLEGGRIHPLGEKALKSYEETAEGLADAKGLLILAGDGAEAGRSFFESHPATKRAVFADMSQTYPRAGNLGKLAAARLAAGEVEGWLEHAPDYLRPSQAERQQEAGQ